MNPAENLYDKIRQDCWTKALEAFGVSYVYKKRIAWLKRWVSLSKITGIALPALLGGMVGSYFQDQDVMKWAIVITSPFAVAQLVFSTILTAQNSEERLVDYVNLATSNNLLSRDFKELANLPPAEFSDLKARYDVLMERERTLTEEDYDLTDEENRKGLRYGLREFQRACKKCGEIPYDMEPTDCPVCGKF